MKALSPEEKAVIESGATEAPFSGRYWNHKADGTYVCRRCGAVVYQWVAEPHKFPTVK